ncbi:glycosyltransferase [Nodularia sphaerocarpa]|uniref:glycosyltransferase n=1 Tax=Nodularia sphaerocarpa TaxID=137816 RepID=UPI001EFC1A44|nr:glycosyltransferase [Nodularia sphaerocarpa]MDB9376117.1 glycosyltransferase [Nodularia sphaerocarpa CS-585]MDB9378239.1 glycosyltransferase [Nodularia sphaerocarpa CS-585A2]ULP71313.1 Putative glycosyltransferase EpsH [Nodularia sphaerocarpa UHCC 0038]
MKTPSLVSVIIACFNADKWLREAIDSCLQQTYSNIEIIVIDDGSTDNTLEIIKSYENKIIWQHLPHQGGNHARNRGFDLSRGEYIQYLDADDYILPEKIERQVKFLEERKADVVYGDWRYQHHLSNGSILLDNIQISQSQTDVLASLLANWWVALAALLYKRTAVENSGGWDETLKAAQDRDFFISVVMNKATVVYQPGCYSIYRKYGSVTVSSSSKTRWVKSHYIVLDKTAKKLLEINKLSLEYRHALAKSYLQLARESLFIDYSQYVYFLNEALAIFPEFKGNSKRPIYNFLESIVGFRQTERIISVFFFVKKFVNSGKSRMTY